MNKIEFSLASEAVRKEFETWKLDLEILAGQSFPSEMPPPEEVAMEQQQLVQQQQQGGGPGSPF